MLAFAFVEEPLPDGIVTIVRLGQPGPLARYAIVSSTGFDDTVMFTAQLSAFAYEMKHEDDQSPVEITVRSDGTTEWVSEQYGRALQTGRSHGVVQDKRRQSGSLLAKLGQIAPRPIPGHGLARIVGVE